MDSFASSGGLSTSYYFVDDPNDVLLPLPPAKREDQPRPRRPSLIRALKHSTPPATPPALGRRACEARSIVDMKVSALGTASAPGVAASRHSPASAPTAPASEPPPGTTAVAAGPAPTDDDDVEEELCTPAKDLEMLAQLLNIAPEDEDGEADDGFGSDIGDSDVEPEVPPTRIPGDAPAGRADAAPSAPGESARPWSLHASMARSSTVHVGVGRVGEPSAPADADSLDGMHFTIPDAAHSAAAPASWATGDGLRGAAMGNRDERGADDEWGFPAPPAPPAVHSARHEPLVAGGLVLPAYSDDGDLRAPPRRRGGGWGEGSGGGGELALGATQELGAYLAAHTSSTVSAGPTRAPAAVSPLKATRRSTAPIVAHTAASVRFPELDVSSVASVASAASAVTGERDAGDVGAQPALPRAEAGVTLADLGVAAAAAAPAGPSGEEAPSGGRWPFAKPPFAFTPQPSSSSEEEEDEEEDQAVPAPAPPSGTPRERRRHHAAAPPGARPTPFAGVEPGTAQTVARQGPRLWRGPNARRVVAFEAYAPAPQAGRYRRARHPATLPTQSVRWVHAPSPDSLGGSGGVGGLSTASSSPRPVLPPERCEAALASSEGGTLAVALRHRAPAAVAASPVPATGCDGVRARVQAVHVSPGGGGSAGGPTPPHMAVRPRVHAATASRAQRAVRASDGGAAAGAGAGGAAIATAGVPGRVIPPAGVSSPSSPAAALPVGAVRPVRLSPRPTATGSGRARRSAVPRSTPGPTPRRVFSFASPTPVMDISHAGGGARGTAAAKAQPAPGPTAGTGAGDPASACDLSGEGRAGSSPDSTADAHAEHTPGHPRLALVTATPGLETPVAVSVAVSARPRAVGARPSSIVAVRSVGATSPTGRAHADAEPGQTPPARHTSPSAPRGGPSRLGQSRWRQASAGVRVRDAAVQVGCGEAVLCAACGRACVDAAAPAPSTAAAATYTGAGTGTGTGAGAGEDTARQPKLGELQRLAAAARSRAEPPPPPPEGDRRRTPPQSRSFDGHGHGYVPEGRADHRSPPGRGGWRPEAGDRMSPGSAGADALRLRRLYFAGAHALKSSYLLPPNWPGSSGNVARGHTVSAPDDAVNGALDSQDPLLDSRLASIQRGATGIQQPHAVAPRTARAAVPQPAPARAPPPEPARVEPRAMLASYYSAAAARLRTPTRFTTPAPPAARRQASPPRGYVHPPGRAMREADAVLAGRWGGASVVPGGPAGLYPREAAGGRGVVGAATLTPGVAAPLSPAASESLRTLHTALAEMRRTLRQPVMQA